VSGDNTPLDKLGMVQQKSAHKGSSETQKREYKQKTCQLKFALNGPIWRSLPTSFFGFFLFSQRQGDGIQREKSKSCPVFVSDWFFLN